MTRFTPAIFKSIPLLLLLISFCAVNVLASPTLHQDIVYVSDNSTSIESAAATSTDGKQAEGTDYTEENANVQQVAETPEPSGNVMGILFVPVDACSENNNPTNITQYQRIALIQQGGCSLYDQIRNVQNQQGVVGVIVYGDGSGSSSKKPKDLKIEIPVLRVKIESGNGLKTLVDEAEAEQPTPDGKRKSVRVVMIPSSSSIGGWQIAIIVIGTLLAASFLVSVLIHCRLYQLRRRERSFMVAQHEANLNAKLQVFTLEKSVVRSFPTRVYRKQEKVSATLGGPDSSRLANSSPDTCSICLEEYFDREMLRELPCSHLYHMECVDKWLTTKSSQCPLCKHDATPPAIAEKREKKYIHTVQVQNRLDDIYNTTNTTRESRNPGESSSTFSRVLDWFGYGGGSSSREAQSSHVRPTGGNLFGIQELPPVVVRDDNLNRV